MPAVTWQDTIAHAFHLTHNLLNFIESVFRILFTRLVTIVGDGQHLFVIDF